jgi:hypothetical protein
LPTLVFWQSKSAFSQQNQQHSPWSICNPHPRENWKLSKLLTVTVGSWTGRGHCESLQGENIERHRSKFPDQKV